MAHDGRREGRSEVVREIERKLRKARPTTLEPQ